MGNKSFQIVGENGTLKKSNKKWIAIGCSAMVVIALCIIGIVSLMNRTPDDYGVYLEKAKIYEENGIKYTYEDYEKDKKAIEETQNTKIEDKTEENGNIKSENTNGSLAIQNENMSDATKQLLSKNDALLNEIEKDTMIDTTVNDVALSIIRQTKDMNEFINNHCGYPDSEWGDEYQGAKEFIDNVVKSMYGEATFEPLYDMSVEQTQAEVRYSILENQQYNVGNGYTQYSKSLSKWMSMGHPYIKSIETISLSKTDNEVFDGVYTNNLNATIVSEGVKYKVYLSSQIIDGGDSFYKVLDIERI